MLLATTSPTSIPWALNRADRYSSISLARTLRGSKVGLGSRFAAATRLFTQGGVETTNSPTDLAIQGHGFFVVQNDQGTNFYTRAGQFNLDKDGFLVNAEGLKVQGMKLDSNGNPVTGPTDIDIDNGLLVAPTATTAIDMALNLDGAATVPALALPADAAGSERASEYLVRGQ